MNKNFEPKDFEGRIYDNWMKRGYFTPTIDKSKKPFCIVIPPPNITGQLHMGHALNNTLQDIIIRYKRMDGFCTLWVPGTDHASIATEVKIVEQIQKEGLTKEGVGREAFLERAYRWKDTYGGKITEQLKRLGTSCDWSREAFTMDAQCSRAVREVFVNLYEKGLIYRGYRMTSWCPSCGTALSDAEIEYEEKPGFLWHVKYPYTDGSGYITVATTRPETILGDTAVAVNPEDERFLAVIGKKMNLPLTDRVIPVIADSYVEKEFGTGAVKITPAHDPNDFEVGKRHDLELVTVIDEKGFMNENALNYRGMTILQCRAKIVEDLTAGGFIEKIEPHTHNVGACYRCSNTVEPRPCEQWYVQMAPLAKPAIDAVKADETRFIPKRFEKIYFNWMENIKDWCISRQLWWGHRIPCWYCSSCGKMIVSKTDPDVCPDCGSTSLKQDEDVLDTWFSSALWPFSTLGYPEKTAELEYFYPTSLLVTAYDIIFFWVARMIFSGIENMGETPFPEVLIHGIVRDGQGRKMSKSLGNGIDPLLLIDRYGADALRFSLSTGVAPGGDIRFSEERIETGRNFMNKLWNAARYVLMNLENKDIGDFNVELLTAADKWILSKLQGVIAEVRKNLDKREIGLACAKIYDFVWNDYCDWYIELSKPVLYGADEELKDNVLAVLKHVLCDILKLIHPFAPFITEEIWQALNISETIMTESYPVSAAQIDFEAQAQSFDKVKEIIVKVRNIRAEMNVPPQKRFGLYIVSAAKDEIAPSAAYIERLANVSAVRFVSDKSEIDGKLCQTATDYAQIYIQLGEMADLEKEIARITKEIEKADAEILRSENMLKNQGFLAKAPEKMVESEREKLEKNKALKASLNKLMSDYN